MAERDPYSVLGVGKGASDAEIKRSFRKKARQFHPDRNPNDAAAEAKFKEVQAAYDKVGTADSRREFDQKQQMENMFGGRGGNPFGGRGGNQFSGRGGNPFGGGGMEDMFGQMFGGGATRQRNQSAQERRPKGADINVGIDITMDEAKKGGKFPFTFKRFRKNGNEMETKTTTLKITIAAGASHGQIKRLKGQGHDHPQGDTGDVLVSIRIDAGEGTYWEDGVLVQEVSTPYSTLVLGGKIKIKLPSGKSGNLSVAANTQIGDRRRMAGAGFDGGDLDLEFVLQETDQLTKQQLKALKTLQESGL
ncbi:MAG TPA: J domain-containing protein [Candidatus Poseidoniales archaeon]|nr:J domain-containing protein [Candidatus Poseidoniales archaeon]